MSIRKIVNLLSLTLFVASPVALGVVYAQTSTSQAVAQSKKVTTEKNFPLNKAQVIDFEPKQGFEKLTERQKLDQLRDWLLITVLSGKGLNSKEINESIYDLPTVRYDFMSPVANFEYGNTRSRYIGDGKVVAIVPKTSSKEERINDLAHIADSQRKNQGEKPKVIEVFEYEINPNNQLATITRRNPINGEQIFSSAYGYYETTISSKNDLQNFLNQVDDTTFAQVNGNSLNLGGRNIYGVKHQNIHLEDIAALWQSEKKIQESPQNFNYVNGSGFSLDPNFDYPGLQKALDNAKPLLQAIKLEGNPVISEQDIQQVKEGLTQKKIQPYRQLVDKLHKFINSDKGHKALNEGEIGKQIKQEVQSYVKRQQEEIDTELKRYGNQLRQEIAPDIAAAQKSGKSPADINLEIHAKVQQQELKYQQFRDNLIKQKQEDENRFILTQEKNKYAEINNFLYTDITKGFIYARYDGDLQGTEVGMNLFYTDLLAKLWGFDYANSAPEKQIQDFKAKKNITVSPIYKEELKKVSATRTWFEPNKKELQVADAGKNLFLSRIVTKVSARSHNPLEGDTLEEAPNAVSNAFVNFWNAHYEEVAEFEPQYKKLNAIMKWSLLISWINHSGNNNLLNFLTDVRVKRDWNFPKWVQANKSQLKFQQWDTQPCDKQSETIIEKPVCFYKPGDKGTKAEAMPVLNSKSFKWFGESGFLSGGVSLSSKDLFSELPSLNKETSVSEVSLRPGIDPDSVKVETDSLTFKSFPTAKDLTKTGNTSQGTKYTFKHINTSEESTTIIPEESLKFRSKNAELTNQPITSKIAQTRDGIKIENDIGDTEFSYLKINKTANGFQVGFESRVIDTSYHVTSKLSTAEGKPLDVLKGMNNVAEVRYSPSYPNNYYVKFSESSRWVKLSERSQLVGGSGKPPTPPAKRLMAVGEPDDGAHIFDLAFLNEEQVSQETQGFQEFSGKIANPQEQFNPHQEAQKLAQDPMAYIVAKKLDLQWRIQNIDAALKNENYTQASQLINESIKLHGSDPNLILRQAGVDVYLGRLNVERITPEGAKPLNGNFFDEISNRNFHPIETDTEFIYVQDSPGLNNLDFKHGVTQSVPFSSGARVYKFQAGKIGGVKIGRSGFGDVSASSNPSTQYQGANTGDSLKFRFNNNPQSFVSENKCDKEEQKDNNGNVKCCTQEGEKDNNENISCIPEKQIYVITIPEKI